ncbi:MAG: CcmD family protein [Candidatus Margulisiibacteriota bacterium]
MENAGYLFAAFAIVWVIIFAYIFILHNKQRSLSRRIETLRAASEEKKAGR